jgi:Carboxypeptidase regulatory-like domain
MQNTMLVTQNSVELRDMGAASGSVTLFRTVGGSLGVALLGSIYTSRLNHALVDRLGAKAGHALTSGGIHVPPSALHTLPAPVRDAFKLGVTGGLHGVVVGGAVLALAGFVVAWFIREVPLRGSGPAPAPAGGTGGRHASGNEQTPVAGGPAPAPQPAYLPAAEGTGPLVRGSVRRADGAPAAGTALTLIDVQGHQVGRTTTRPDGCYGLPAPGRGTYVLIAGAGEHAPQADTLVIGDGPVDFDVTLAGSGGLVGTARDTDGEPVRDARVVVTDLTGEVVATGMTDADGGYALPQVAAGTYTLAVSVARHRPVAIPVEVRKERTRQDVELPPAARISGVVQADGRGPLPDARVTLLDAAGNIVDATITGPDGQYTFTDLTGGQYTVTASGYPPVASAVTLNGHDENAFDMRLGHPAE